MDVWMTEVADAAPSSWVHCWYCVFQLCAMNALWEFQGFDILQPCWWTCLDIINSIRKTALGRSLDQRWSIIQQFTTEKEKLMKRYSRRFKMMCVCVQFFLVENPPPVICNASTFVLYAASPAVGSTAAPGHCCSSEFTKLLLMNKWF